MVKRTQGMNWIRKKSALLSTFETVWPASTAAKGLSKVRPLRSIILPPMTTAEATTDTTWLQHACAATAAAVPAR